jgi:glycerol-3-phosphate acyltransferase PlsY
MIAYAAAIVCGYLLGSIPFGLIAGRLFRGVDVRDYGSGKTGFTNTLRVLGLQRSLLVFGGDFGKGAAATLLPLLFSDDPWVRAFGGLAAVVGHVWPLFAGFQGGRGVLTGAGVLVAFDPLVIVVMLPVALAAFVLTRTMSVVSLTSALAAALAFVAFAAFGIDPWAYAVTGGIGVALVVAMHAQNIARLRRGEEPRIGEGGHRRLASGG